MRTTHETVLKERGWSNHNETVLRDRTGSGKADRLMQAAELGALVPNHNETVLVA